MPIVVDDITKITSDVNVVNQSVYGFINHKMGSSVLKLHERYLIRFNQLCEIIKDSQAYLDTRKEFAFNLLKFQFEQTLNDVGNAVDDDTIRDALNAVMCSIIMQL